MPPLIHPGPISQRHGWRPRTGLPQTGLPRTALPTRIAAGLVALVLALIAFAGIVPPASAHDSSVGALTYSRSADRAAPVELGGALLGGSVYIFMPADPGVVRVEFFLDDPSMTSAPRRVENTAPFDFAGGSVASATAIDTRSILDGAHTITARLTYGDGDVAGGETTFQVSNPPVASVTRLNSGGSKTTTGGLTWYSDAYFVGGKSLTNTAVTAIAGTTDDTLYRNERTSTTRLGGFAYAIPAAVVGSYTVTLHFAENFFGAPGGGVGGVGKRVFSTNFEGGAIELADFDIFQAVGATTATTRTFTVPVTDGTLDIAFTATVDRPSVAAISITPPGLVAAPAPLIDPAAFAWETRAPSPIPRSEAQGEAVDGKIYVFGGFFSGTTATARSSVFDTVTNTWSALPDLPMLLSHSATVVDGSTIWLVGGYVGSHPGGATVAVWKFDTVTSVLSAAPSLPAPRGAGAASIVGRNLHFFGGTDRPAGTSSDTDQGDHWVLALDGGTGWSALAPLANPRNHLTAATVDDSLYAIGGQHAADEVAGLQDDVDRYDPATDTWTPLAALPKARSHIASVVRDGQILVLGGTNPGATSSKDVTAFDPASETWSKLPQLPGGRKTPVAGLIGDNVWLTGGSLSTSTYRGRFADRWEYGPAMPIALGEVAGGMIGRSLYLVGESSVATLALDVGTGLWRSDLAARPFPGSHHAAEVIGGELYLFGGIGASAGRVQIFDPISNAWRLGPDMPFAAGSSSSAVIGGVAYVAGGIVGQATTARAARFDPVSAIWTEIAPMPVGRNHAASATDGASLWIFGGRGFGSGDNNSVANGFDTVQVYDPATDAWRVSTQPEQALAPLPQARGGMGRSVYVDGEFYVIGGETVDGAGATSNRVYSRVDIYDPAMNRWRPGAPMLTARHGIFPVVIAHRITVAGGGTKAGFSSSSVTQSYTAARAT